MTRPRYAADPNQTFYKLNDVFPAAVSIEKGTWPIPLGDKGGELFRPQSPQTIDKDSAITPYIQRWSLDIQRELGKSTVATLGYVGSGGTKLTTQYDLNLPAQGVYLTATTSTTPARSRRLRRIAGKPSTPSITTAATITTL